MKTSELKQNIMHLWDSNYLNFQKGCDEANTRTPKKLCVAIELADTMIDKSNTIYPYALETLKILSFNPIFFVYFNSYLPEEWVKDFVKMRIGIKIEINKNYYFSTPRPYYDVLIDGRSGFNPQDWFWVYHLSEVAKAFLEPHLAKPIDDISRTYLPVVQEPTTNTAILRGRDKYTNTGSIIRKKL